jgi:hypothetical protein
MECLLLTCIIIISLICVCHSLDLQLMLEPFASLHAGLKESHPLFKTGMLWLVVLQGMGHSAHAICSWHSWYKQQLQKQHYVLRGLQVLPLCLTFNPSLILLHSNSLCQANLYDDISMHLCRYIMNWACWLNRMCNRPFIYYTFVKSIQGSTTKFMVTEHLAQWLIVCWSCRLGKHVKQHGLTEFILDHSKTVKTHNAAN